MTMTARTQESHSQKKKKKKKIVIARTRQVGRPPKSDNEKTVSSFHYPCRAEEQQTIQTAIERLSRETGNMIDVNRQLVIRLLLRRLKNELKTNDFSMVENYLQTQNLDTA